MKAYLEADVDEVNRYLGDSYGKFYELGWKMDVDGIPTVIESKETSTSGIRVIVEAHGEASHDPVVQYFVVVVDRKVVNYGRHH